MQRFLVESDRACKRCPYLRHTRAYLFRFGSIRQCLGSYPQLGDATVGSSHDIALFPCPWYDGRSPHAYYSRGYRYISLFAPWCKPHRKRKWHNPFVSRLTRQRLRPLREGLRLRPPPRFPRPRPRRRHPFRREGLRPPPPFHPVPPRNLLPLRARY